MVRKLSLILLLSISLIVSGCFGDISGTVSKDGVGVEGLRVVLSGKAYMTGLTDDAGAFVFRNVRGFPLCLARFAPATFWLRSPGRSRRHRESTIRGQGPPRHRS